MKKTLLISICSLLVSLSVHSQSQNALAFDGLDDNATAPAASSLIAGSPNISLTCWVYPTNASPVFPNFDGFAGFRNNLDADFYVMQYSPSNNVEARFRDATGVDHTISWNGLVLNTWQHFALTLDGAMLRLYYNGAPADSIPASGTITNAIEDFYIGDLLFNANHYSLTGKTDEVSLWSKTLSAQEINCMYNNSIDTASVDLQLYYKCNQGIPGGSNTSQTFLIDASGHINATLNNLSLTGSVSNFVAGITTTSTVITDTICQGDSYIFGSLVLTLAGNYTQQFSLTPTCDSLVELNLSVTPVDTVVVTNGPSYVSHANGAIYQWVDCGNNFAVIPGATGQVYTPPANQSVAVIVTQNGCSDTSACYGLTGINENSLQSHLSVFPNPSQNNFTIDFGSMQQEVSLSVKNMEGKEILNTIVTDSKHVAVDAIQWSKGIYILKVISQNQAAHVKMCKQ